MFGRRESGVDTVSTGIHSLWGGVEMTVRAIWFPVAVSSGVRRISAAVCTVRTVLNAPFFDGIRPVGGIYEADFE